MQATENVVQAPLEPAIFFLFDGERFKVGARPVIHGQVVRLDSPTIRRKYLRPWEDRHPGTPWRVCVKTNKKAEQAARHHVQYTINAATVGKHAYLSGGPGRDVRACDAINVSLIEEIAARLPVAEPVTKPVTKPAVAPETNQHAAPASDIVAPSSAPVTDEPMDRAHPAAQSGQPRKKQRTMNTYMAAGTRVDITQPHTPMEDAGDAPTQHARLHEPDGEAPLGAAEAGMSPDAPIPTDVASAIKYMALPKEEFEHKILLIRAAVREAEGERRRIEELRIQLALIQQQSTVIASFGLEDGLRCLDKLVNQRMK